jgi:hypothetical protein
MASIPTTEIAEDAPIGPNRAAAHIKKGTGA